MTCTEQVPPEIGAHWENTIPALINTLLPGTKTLPTGLRAGVDSYLKTVVSRYRISDAGNLARCCNVSQFLARQWFSVAFQDLVPVERTFVVRAIERSLSAEFLRVRDMCLEGYFGHPRWREGRGWEIWPAIGFRPVLRPEEHQRTESIDLLFDDVAADPTGIFSDDIRDY